MNLLSQALTLLRKYHQLKQSDLAKKLEISAPYLCEIEKGSKEPSIEILNKYSEVFKMPVSTILLFSERISSPPRPSEGLRVVAAEKVVKLFSWMDEKLAVEQDA